jgi:hypothetical protein
MQPLDKTGCLRYSICANVYNQAMKVGSRLVMVLVTFLIL